MGHRPINGQSAEIIHLPGNSWWPLFAAMALAVVCLSLLTRLYPLAGIAVVVAGLFLLRWSWENGAHPKAAPDAEVAPGDPPLHSRTMDGPGLWAMSITLLANGSFFLSYLFGWFYLWTVSPEWRMPETSPLSLVGLILAGVALTAGVGILEKLVHGLRQGKDAGLAVGMYCISALGFVQVAITLWVLLSADLAVTETSHDAIIMVGLAYALLHGGLGAVLTLLQACG
ncbi:hypothetical protein [Halomonas sp. PA16-9]|uniref:hypothetical protein n=1 Tax=Halomonas sp. PA16-9 TaxID=2576841 RepID=UPI003FA5E6B4